MNSKRMYSKAVRSASVLLAGGMILQSSCASWSEALGITIAMENNVLQVGLPVGEISVSQENGLQVDIPGISVDQRAGEYEIHVGP